MCCVGKCVCKVCVFAQTNIDSYQRLSWTLFAWLSSTNTSSARDRYQWNAVGVVWRPMRQAHALFDHRCPFTGTDVNGSNSHLHLCIVHSVGYTHWWRRHCVTSTNYFSENYASTSTLILDNFLKIFTCQCPSNIQCKVMSCQVSVSKHQKLDKNREISSSHWV